MSEESQHVDKKSLRAISGSSADWAELAKDCIAFANAQGGRLLIGIEDDEEMPPPNQRIDPAFPDRVRRRIGELTVNVVVVPEIRRARDGGEFLEVRIPRSMSIASTTDGRYFLRVSDQSKPIVGDDVMRLAAERSMLPWETLSSQRVRREQIDARKLAELVAALRSSDRVKSSVRDKSDQELLDHYALAQGEWLTNLGILFIGQRSDRGGLGTAPVIQIIKYDEQEKKVNKLVWDDFELNPAELVEAVWREVPDFREHYELPDGLYRQSVPAYDEIVVRELLVNALVHRPYTQRGDIFVNLHPDRLEVVSPGLLPLGVTPANILHTTVRRNENMARLLHDLKLMEREGSGFDKMFEILLTQGRRAPELREGNDRVQVTVGRRILNPRVIDFIAKADKTFQPSPRERIALGLVAQHDSLTVRELARLLDLTSVAYVQPWLKRPLEWGLIRSAGRTQAKRYFIDPEVLRNLNVEDTTTLRRIEPHRLAALIEEDLRRYPVSRIGEIHKRIGLEISRPLLRRVLDRLVRDRKLVLEGVRSAARYRLAA